MEGGLGQHAHQRLFDSMILLIHVSRRPGGLERPRRSPYGSSHSDVLKLFSLRDAMGKSDVAESRRQPSPALGVYTTILPASGQRRRQVIFFHATSNRWLHVLGYRTQDSIQSAITSLSGLQLYPASSLLGHEW